MNEHGYPRLYWLQFGRFKEGCHAAAELDGHGIRTCVHGGFIADRVGVDGFLTQVGHGHIGYIVEYRVPFFRLHLGDWDADIVRRHATEGSKHLFLVVLGLIPAMRHELFHAIWGKGEHCFHGR